MGCSNTKFLEDGQALLVKHKVEYVQPDTVVDTRSIASGLLRTASQQPNDKMLGIARVRLWLHNRTRKAKGGVFKSIHDKGSEPPVIFDSTKARESTEAMIDYLFDKGYFHGRVTYSVKVDSTRHKSKKKATVTYHVWRGELSYVDSVIYDIKDERMNTFKDEGIEKSPLKAGKPYDADDLRYERSRIALIMQDWGYRDFTNQYVHYEADTLDPGNNVTVYVMIAPPEGDSVHRVFFIGNIYVYPDYDQDTIIRTPPKDTVKEDVTIIYHRLRYNPQALVNPIQIRSGALYSRDKYLRTARRFSELDEFQFVNIEYANDRDTLGRHRVCDVEIKLTPAKRRSFSVEVAANSSSDQFKGIGSEVKVAFANRNVFRFTDQFNFNVSSGIETSFDTLGFHVNTFDFNVDASVTVPKWVLPPPFRYNPPTRRLPKTVISSRYSLLKRVGFYDFQSLAMTYAIDYQDNPYNRWTGALQLLFSGLIDSTAAFEAVLDVRPSLRRSFETVRIFGPSLTFAYSNQAKIDRKTRHIFFGRLSTDWGVVPGVYFSTFAKFEGEVKRLLAIGRRSSLVGRLTSGIAIPIGQDEVVPYIKQFVIGGPNSIRAWRVRTLGPGAFALPDSVEFQDQSGDIKIEANIEFRFDLLSWLKAALFIDAGNIWLIKPNPELPGGEFTVATFLDQVAVGSGAGLRFDFDFFIIRFDVGTKLRYPTTGEWLPDDVQLGQPEWRRKEMNFNLGIGYPF